MNPLAATQAHFISPSQLCVGLYVQLDLSWTEHPFTLSNFLIKSAEQVAQIQALGLKQVRYVPERSHATPLAAAVPSAGAAPGAAAAPPAVAPPPAPLGATAAVRRELIARLDAHVERLRHCERALATAARTVGGIGRHALSQPALARRQADELIDSLLLRMPATNEVAIHLMSEKVEGQRVYQHGLNVAVLAMMLGRELRLSDAELHELGTAAVFHDIGELQLPDTVVKKKVALNPHEERLMATHVGHGVEIARRLQLSDSAVRVVGEHHEHCDGSGYPQGLSGPQMAPLSKVIAVVNAFDELINARDPARSMTPHEALSLMYGQQRSRFDLRVIASFVKCMGIYPPGTIVGLSDGTVGLVVSVNSSRPLKPAVMVMEAAAPKSPSRVLDLEQCPGLTVVRTLKPEQFAAFSCKDLVPRRRTSYFMDAQPASGGAR